MYVLLMVISVLLLGVLGAVVYVLMRYLPIISNLFLDITVKTRPGHDPRLDGETVRFVTSDGVKLTGTLTPGGRHQPVIIFCHEFSADRHAASRYAYFLREAGFRIFTFDFRGHGDSEAPAGYVSRLWVTEAEMRDFDAAFDYLMRRDDVNTEAIGLFGVSRGGGVALCGASRHNGVIKAVVTDGAYSAHRTLCDYMRKWVPIFARVRWVYQHHPDWLYRLLGWAAIKVSEWRIHCKAVSLEKSMRDLKTPTLLVHGERDNYLDVAQARYLAQLNSGHVELWVIPGTDHNEAVVQVRDQYCRRLTDFFVTHLDSENRRLTDQKVCAGADHGR